MYEQLRGKKLLILGAGPNEVTLVQRAQSFGVYTIATDYNLDFELSPAKKYADEVWNISWSDLDTLEQLCREKGVDGILAGYSEFRVENMIRLCERLGLPCYITQEQLDITRDKIKFKNACRASGVPVVKEYPNVEAVDAFPVIVKPVDRAGSIGVGIATNPQELKQAYAYAMEMSVCKEVIIEEFIHKGTKIDVYYAVADGRIMLLTSNDVINAKDNGFDRVVQSAWVFPSRYHELFRQTVDMDLRRMIRDMGIQNGYIFFSGFHEAGRFVFFEAGFRLCGGHIYNYLTRMGLGNNMDWLICHALGGQIPDLPLHMEGVSDCKCVNINFYAKNGTIGEVRGFDEIKKEGCDFLLAEARVGQVCTQDTAILSKLGMCYFCDPDPKVLVERIRDAYTRIAVTDTRGGDMIYDRIEAEQILSWWSEER